MRNQHRIERWTIEKLACHLGRKRAAGRHVQADRFLAARFCVAGESLAGGAGDEYEHTTRHGGAEHGVEPGGGWKRVDHHPPPGTEQGTEPGLQAGPGGDDRRIAGAELAERCGRGQVGMHVGPVGQVVAHVPSKLHAVKADVDSARPPP